MRHRKKGRQFGRNTKHRHAMFRNIVTSLLEHERIETTEAKAKEVRGIAEKMITLGKAGSLHARRQALSFIQKKDIVSKLFDDVAGRFSHRAGGYTRIIPTRRRPGDGAEMVALELIERESSTADEKDSENTSEAETVTEKA